MVVCILLACSLLFSPGSSLLEFLKLGFRCFCSHSPGQHFILLAEPAFSLFGQRSFGGDQTFCKCFFAQTEVSLMYPLLIPTRFDQHRRDWLRSNERFCVVLP